MTYEVRKDGAAKMHADRKEHLYDKATRRQMRDLGYLFLRDGVD